VFILPFLNKVLLGNQRFHENFHLLDILQILNNEGMIKLECHFFAALSEILHLGIVHRWLLLSVTDTRQYAYAP